MSTHPDPRLLAMSNAQRNSHLGGESGFLTRAYALSSPDAARALYDEWAKSYDKDISELDYSFPEAAAAALVDSIAPSDKDGKASARIFDAGCGTGFVGVSLAKLGFANIDGCDISPGMLDVARGLGVYQILEVVDLTKRIDGKEDGAYDAVTCVGTLTRGHVGPAVIDEFVRVVKADRGVVVATILDEIWESAGFREKVERLKEAKLVEVVRNEVIGITKGEEIGGRLLVLRKL